MPVRPLRLRGESQIEAEFAQLLGGACHISGLAADLVFGQAVIAEAAAVARTRPVTGRKRLAPAQAGAKANRAAAIKAETRAWPPGFPAANPAPSWRAGGSRKSGRSAAVRETAAAAANTRQASARLLPARMARLALRMYSVRASAAAP